MVASSQTCSATILFRLVFIYLPHTERLIVVTPVASVVCCAVLVSLTCHSCVSPSIR
jgi:hypothetical protein